MTGLIRLYSHNDNRIRSEFYSSKEDRNKILEKWTSFYKPIKGWYIRIVPFIHEARVIKMKPVEFINKEKAVINKKREIELPDYVQMGPFRRETWFHKTYYRDEK